MTPKVSWGTISAANTAMDGTGTVVIIFTSGTYGSRIDEFRIKSLGTNVQTALRLFVNNGSDTTVASNNSLIYDITIPATTASNSASLGETIIQPTNLVLTGGYRITMANGTAISAGLQVTVIGSDY